MQPSVPATQFYEWDGDACRVHQHENGDVTADIYRGGKGIVPVAANDVQFEGVEINESAYKRLVLNEIALDKNRNAG